MPRTVVTRWLQVFIPLLASGAVGAHPLDPLTADEIIGAANALLLGGAAQPGAIFQSIELREPSKSEVIGGGASSSRQAAVFWRQNKQRFKSVVNVQAGSFTPRQLIPRTQGQLELRPADFFDRNPALDLRRPPFEVPLPAR